jgi:hypothetical protein
VLSSNTAYTSTSNGVPAVCGSGAPVTPTPGVKVCPGRTTIVFDGPGVGVGVGVPVGVGVGVSVGVAVAVGRPVGVAVGVKVGVGVGGGSTVVEALAWLFVSSASVTSENGSTVTVFTAVPAFATVPVTVSETDAPDATEPRLHSRRPPVNDPTTLQSPAVVEKLAYVKSAGG